MTKFRGLGTALITPFTDSGALDESALERFVDFQIDGGVDFLVPCGTTGENPALTPDEHRRVVEIVVHRANGRVPVLAGAGSNSTPRAIELAEQAIDLGADGVLTITPYYNKPTPDGLRRHFGMQAEAIEKKKPRLPDDHVQRPRPHRREHDRGDDAAHGRARSRTSSASRKRRPTWSRS